MTKIGKKNGSNRPVFPIPGWPSIAHLDIKPENIFVAGPDSVYPPYPTIQLGDFGLAFEHLHKTLVDYHLQRWKGTETWEAPVRFGLVLLALQTNAVPGTI